MGQFVHDFCMVTPKSAWRREFAGRAAELRAAAGMTQAEMAAALGIPLERYKKYENRSAMPVDLLEPFSRLVNRSIEFVVAGRDPSRRRGPKPNNPRQTPS